MEIEMTAYTVGGKTMKVYREVTLEEAGLRFYREHLRTASNYRSQVVTYRIDGGEERPLTIRFASICPECGERMSPARTRSARHVECPDPECGFYISIKAARYGREVSKPVAIQG